MTAARVALHPYTGGISGPGFSLVNHARKFGPNSYGSQLTRTDLLKLSDPQTSQEFVTIEPIAIAKVPKGVGVELKITPHSQDITIEGTKTLNGNFIASSYLKDIPTNPVTISTSKGPVIIYCEMHTQTPKGNELISTLLSIAGRVKGELVVNPQAVVSEEVAKYLVKN